MKSFILILAIVALTIELKAQEEKSFYPKSGVKKMIVLEQDYDNGKPDGGDEIKTATIFDKKGNIIEEIDYKDGKVNKSVIYEYNESGQKTKETEKDEDGKVDKVTVYKYKDGLRVEKTVYNKDNRIKSIKKYKYEKF